MSYKYEKNPISGESELVIDGWEKGIADSPYDGIANIRNLNVGYYPGVAYVNYKRLPATISGGTMKEPLHWARSTAGLAYVLDSSGQVWKQSAAGSTTFNLLTGNPTGGSTGAGGQGLAFWNNYLFVFRNTSIDVCGDGTGDAGITSSNWNVAANAANGVWPIEFNSTLTLSGTPSAGDTTATLTSYTDAQGTSRAFWNGPTGLYRMTFDSTSSGQAVNATLTQGSSDIVWTPALTKNAISTGAQVTPVAASTGFHMALVSGNDQNLYFCNGSSVGALSVPSGSTLPVRMTDMKTYNFSYSALGLPTYETSVWLTELVSNLLVAGAYKIYPWDRISTSWKNPIPTTEQIYRIVNVLNKVYILAGNKGNIYIFNGYSADPYVKLPDSVPNVIDATWTWGGIMPKRQKLYFQALAQSSQSVSNLIVGIWSIDVNTNALTMEGQNSNSISDTKSGAGVLFENILPYSQVNTQFVDNYYSGWSNGTATAGGIDYNDATLYQNFEPFIETDLIPIGTFLQSRTFSGGIEFKLDEPLASGDQIRLSYRKSLSDSYTVIGTTTTALLSDFFPPNIDNAQWVQFKVEFKCASSNSSFIRLRELRLHFV